jgi:hypothetical protein
MVSGAGGYHSGGALGWRQTGDAIVSAPDFEAENGLLILTLQPDCVVDALRKPRCRVE